MARIRSIKPEFWKSEAIARLPHRTRLTFIALWSYVDDNGVGRDVPQLIAGELFALEPDPREALANVREDLARLSDEGRIVRYGCNGKPFLCITGWDEHQRIDKPNKARYPRPVGDAPSLTCGYGESRESPAKVSRESSEVQRPEQWNRGTEEQGIETPRSTALSLIERPRFDEWWQTYPRRVGKKDAKTAYDRAARQVSHDVLLAGAVRYRDDPTRDPAFTAHPATWLRAGRWDDEGPARPHSTTSTPTTTAKVQQTLLLGEHFRQLDNQGEIA